MSHYAKSLTVTWEIAAWETLNLRQSFICPPHLFLGMLKVVEIDLDKYLQSTADRQRQEIKRDIAALKNCLGEFILDLTTMRRSLRRSLPRDTVSVKPPAHRDDRSRKIFADAEQLARPNNAYVTPLHLLSALLAADDETITATLAEFQVPVAGLKNYATTFCVRSGKTDS